MNNEIRNEETRKVFFKSGNSFGIMENIRIIPKKSNILYPISFAGGKYYLMNPILLRFPYSYEKMTYVEPFAGSGKVLFYKNPSKVEVLNDKNSMIYNFFSVIRDNYKEFISLFKNIQIHDERLFNEYKLKLKAYYKGLEIFKQKRHVDTIKRLELKFFYPFIEFFEKNPDSENSKSELEKMKNSLFKNNIEMAIAYYYYLAHNFQSINNMYYANGFSYSFKKSGWGFLTSVRDFYNIKKRFRNVTLFNRDFRWILENANFENAFVYLDPPYYEINGLYVLDFNKKDHEDLAKFLKSFKGKFLLSYNGVDWVYETYKDFQIDKFSFRKNVPVQLENNGKKEKVYEYYDEVLIYNYPFEKTVGWQVFNNNQKYLINFNKDSVVASSYDEFLELEDQLTGILEINEDNQVFINKSLTKKQHTLF